jgi:transglutaminase-like putative cysteine protease
MAPGPTAIAPLERYLESTPVIDWKTPLVLTTARDLAAEIESGTEKARVLFEWVRDHIPHSRDIGSEKVTCTASEVLGEKTGICYAKSHLLADLRVHPSSCRVSVRWARRK